MEDDHSALDGGQHGVSHLGHGAALAGQTLGVVLGVLPGKGAGVGLSDGHALGHLTASVHAPVADHAARVIDDGDGQRPVRFLVGPGQDCGDGVLCLSQAQHRLVIHKKIPLQNGMGHSNWGGA